jgi:hypothetical protein|tara:strand:+ start:1049 stop:1345 length:297 start_codon:yes stop_codon:yes gene_type:complete
MNIEPSKHMNELENRYKMSNRRPKITITNTVDEHSIITTYESFEKALRKIYLDMMTNLANDFTEPIQVKVEPVFVCSSCESVEIDPERDYKHECKSCR